MRPVERRECKAGAYDEPSPDPRRASRIDGGDRAEMGHRYQRPYSADDRQIQRGAQTFAEGPGQGRGGYRFLSARTSRFFAFLLPPALTPPPTPPDLPSPRP